MKEPRFQVGDRVLFVSYADGKWGPQTGVIHHVYPYAIEKAKGTWGYLVSWPTSTGTASSSFAEDELDAAWVNHWRE